MDCRVVVEAAVPVYDVETADEAVRIAISKTGEMLNPDLNYVEINMGSRTGPDGEEIIPAFIAADEALVALELEMTVFNVDRHEHASRIARKEIGQRLRNIPLKVLEVEEIETENEDEDESDGADEDAEAVDEGDDPENQAAEENESELDGDDVENDGADVDGDGNTADVLAGDSETVDDADRGDELIQSESTKDDEDLLPEFEEMVDESTSTSDPGEQ